MMDFLVIVILAAIIGGALWYIRREKQKGKKCVGCPYAGSCSGGCNCK